MKTTTIGEISPTANLPATVLPPHPNAAITKSAGADVATTYINLNVMGKSSATNCKISFSNNEILRNV